MKKSITFLAMIVWLFVACKNNTDFANENSETAKNQETAVHTNNEHTEHPGAVVLNDGQKWNANAETTEGIGKMSALLETLSKDPTVEDCHSLKMKLENEFNMILQKCTMTGEAHNQLHNYLLPMQDMMAMLDSNSAEKCKEASDHLKQHLGEYDSYFQ